MLPEGLRKIGWLGLYAFSMGCLEAVVVAYLRRIHYPDNPLAVFPMKAWSTEDLLVEIVREAATVAMILAAAALAERGRTRIFAAFAFIFGVWDLAYYFWLKVFLGWPVSWMEWDILFLIPWAWLGPWLAPAAVAAVLAVWGGRVVGSSGSCRFGPYPAALFGGGCLLVVAAFLQPAFPLLSQGPKGLSAFRPGNFLWPLFLPGLALLSAGLVGTVRRKGGGA